MSGRRAPIVAEVRDEASGEVFYGVIDDAERCGGFIVTKAEAVDLLGGDWVAERLLTTARPPEAQIPAIISTDRRRFSVVDARQAAST